MDAGDDIIFANWTNGKHIICNTNNDIPVKIPSHWYVLVNRGSLCNCGIEADNHYLLESLAACDNKISKLTMYFTINTAFTNYLEMFPNLIDSLQTPLIKNRTMYKQTLPITLSVSTFDHYCMCQWIWKILWTITLREKKFLICKKGMIPHLILTKISFQITTSWTFSYLFLL